jgi:hypothetical protein
MSSYEFPSSTQGASPMSPQNRFGQMSEGSQGTYREAQDRVVEAYHQTEDMVRQHPASSALVTFGVGFGLGLLLTAMLSPPSRRQSWYESHMPSMPNMPSMPDWFSRDQLTDAIARVMPDALRKRLS